jgi:hypothetical protein
MVLDCVAFCFTYLDKLQNDIVIELKEGKKDEAKSVEGVLMDTGGRDFRPGRPTRACRRGRSVPERNRDI